MTEPREQRRGGARLSRGLRMGLVGATLAASCVGGVALQAQSASAACSIPASQVSVSGTDTSHTNDQAQAWDNYRLTTTISHLDGMAAGCTVVQTLSEPFAQIPAQTRYLNADNTSSSTPQANTVMVMSVDPSARTITYTTTDYPATHTGVSATGFVDVGIDASIKRGQTSPLNVDVNGVTVPAGSVTGAICDTDCPAVPVDQAAKYGRDFGNGTGIVQVVTPVITDAGTSVAITDDLTSSGESFAGPVSAAGYTCVSEWGDPGNVDADGSCNTSIVKSVQVTGENGNYQVVTTEPNQFVRINIGMQFTGSGPWNDTATVTAPGKSWTARTSIVSATVGGGATGSDAPTTPAPKPTTPSIPAPKPTTPSKPTTPTTPAPKPTTPVMRTWTYTVQADRYSPDVAGNRAATASNRALVASLDNDGVLKYREDMGTKCSVRNSPVCMWYHTSHSFVSFAITQPAASGAPSQAQILAAFNKAAPAAWRVSTTARTTSVTGAVTEAWLLGSGATVAQPWGASHGVNQVFLGRS